MPHLDRKGLVVAIVGLVLLFSSAAVCAGDPVTLVILAPEAGSEFQATETIDFAGRGFLVRSDGTKEAISADSLRWTSSVDGNIGVGSSFAVRLSVGAHTITLSEGSSEESSTTTSTAITIVE